MYIYIYMYISGHPAGLKVLETENHKRANSISRNVELPQTVIFIVELYFFNFDFTSLPEKKKL